MNIQLVVSSILSWYLDFLELERAFRAGIRKIVNSGGINRVKTMVS